jgi:NAD(P) transhydrogenase subunit alpha
VIGHINLASTVPYHASQMYAKNVTTFLLNMIKDKQLRLNREDEIVRDTLLTEGGEIVNERVRQFFSLPALAAQST